MADVLHGMKILVLEDEFLSAMDLASMIEDLGGTVVGPVGRIGQARRLAEQETIDAAILDVKLDGETSAELARELIEREIPVVFATGYESDMLPPGLTSTPRLAKPYTGATLKAMAERHLLRH
jgi:DNA-binding response OmpR family regulator